MFCDFSYQKQFQALQEKFTDMRQILTLSLSCWIWQCNLNTLDLKSSDFPQKK